MVRADPKRDYYADLDLPSTADVEEIKKQFRLLAKLYHPDRNPGKEVEFVPKFQAVQAAHEILCDPTEKAKYDTARAKLMSKANNLSATNEYDPYSFRKPSAAKSAQPTHNFPFPPPPKGPPPAKAPFPPSPGPRKPAPSPDKFNAFVRAGNQQWDRSKFEEERARQQDFARGFQSMRTPPLQPPRPGRAPTAQQPPAPSPTDQRLPSYPPSAGFPGMSRTTGVRRSGFAPGTPGEDEPMAARTSAYATYARQDRPQPSPQSYDQSNLRSPPQIKVNPSLSPLRHVRSEMGTSRPGLHNRTSSRYAEMSGEKTNINATELGRSSSVRNSPLEPQWEESGPFGHPRPHSHNGPAPRRHRSASPNARSQGVKFEFSDEDSSSSGEETNNQTARPKAQPRRPQVNNHKRGHSMADDEPALTGHFPNTNYTTHVDDTQYKYPAPGGYTDPGRGEQVHSDKEPAPPGTNGVRHVHKEDVPGFNSQAEHDTKLHDPPESTFSAADWTGKFDSGVFLPTDTDRRSPLKTTRSVKSTSRGRTASKSAENISTVEAEPQSSTPANNFSASTSKSDAFQPGKFSAEEWSEKLKNQTWEVPHSDLNGTKSKTLKRGSRSNGVKRNAVSTDDKVDSTDEAEEAQRAASPDIMDIDDTADVHVDSPRNRMSRSNTDPGVDAPAAKRQQASSMDLNELSKSAPFAASKLGLENMDDLATFVPFESRASILSGPVTASSARDLRLPKPPKPVIPPSGDGLNQATWRDYVHRMTDYMKEWNQFNLRMIEHFHLRQVQVNELMSENWISAVGDGPAAEKFDEFSGSGQNAKKAGYAAYITWLADDSKCRIWWDYACEGHRKCLEDLGRIRTSVKARA